MSELRRDPFGSDADALSARLAAPSRAAPKSPNEALQPEPVPPPPPRSQAVRHPLVVFLNFALTVVIVAMVAVGAAFFLGKMQFERRGSLDQAGSITIEPGKGLTAIADQLQKDGFINSKWLFVAGVWLSSEENGLKAGEYLIPARASMREIMDTIVSGKGILYSITVPEGLTSQQVADRVNADPVLVGDPVDPPAEGSVLPETYKFTRGDTRQNLVVRMQRERDRVLADIWKRKAPDLPLASVDQLVILASIVEKETALADERSRVAAVFINRLRLNMKLQSDPTVIYGLFGGKGKPQDYSISKNDLDSNTPYNTYVISGLPPGPIGNPGRASLEAVANPSRTRELFFVADGTGGHVFAETYEEHLRNVARWRQVSGQTGPAAADQPADPAASSGNPPPPPTPPPKPVKPAQ